MYYEDPEINDDRQYSQYCLDNNGKSIIDENKNEINLFKILVRFINIEHISKEEIESILMAMELACTKTIEIAIDKVSECYPDQEKEAILRVYNMIKLK